MVRSRCLKLVFLLLLAVIFTQPSYSVEWRLTLKLGPGFFLEEPPATISSASWQAQDQGFVFITMMESNEVTFNQPSGLTLDLGLEAWITPRWGIMLQGGYAPVSQSASNQYKLDFMWFDDESGWRYRTFDTASRLNRLFFDLLLSHRQFFGYRTSTIFNAGLGLHHFHGRLRRNYGWAAAISGDAYHFDYFILPLQAEFADTRLVAQLGAAFEYRLSRTIVGRLGVSWWYGHSFKVPFHVADEQTKYYGIEGHMVLNDARGLLSADELNAFTLNPSALRFTAGISFWL